MTEPLTLKPYQKVARNFMLDTPRCNLWMPMGGGKTLGVLSVVDCLMLAGSSFLPALVIAPKRVAQVVWTGEQERWDDFQGIKVQRILGTPKEREAAMRWKADVYVINYDLVPWLIAKLRGKWPFKIVICDESTRLKNFRLMGGGGMRANALSYIARHTGRWINLTGTPATNGLQDLWGQNWFVDFGERLGRSYAAYQRRWFIEEAYTQRLIPVGNAEAQIHDALKDVALAFKLEDCLPVKEPLYIRIAVQLPPDAMQLYRKMERDFFVKLETGEVEAVNAMAKSTKLLQLASGAIYDEDHVVHEVHRAKIDALKELLEDLNDENLLVAFHFKSDAARIARAIPQARILQSERDIAAWNAGETRVLLAHPQSAGHGINLARGGRNIAFFTQSWDLELRQQIIERLGPARQAQLGTGLVTRIFDLLAEKTLDVDVLERIGSKMSVQQALMLARSRR